MNIPLFKKFSLLFVIISFFVCFKIKGQQSPAYIQTGATVDLAQTATIIANTGSNSSFGSALDRNFLARTSFTLGAYFVIDLGASYNISYLSFGSYYNSDAGNIPSGWTIEYSATNSSGTGTVYATQGAGNTNVNPSYSSAFTARYIKFTVTALHNNPAVVSGFQIFSILGGAIGNNLWTAKYQGTNIFTNTNVAIGTSVPANGYKLSVNGPTVATSMTVLANMNWPDYVFDKNYSLPPISKVKTFIEQNQHLPDIPSEQQIAKSGQDLGEMNKLLLKKVEELTLYLIEYDKTINSLNEKINKQQAIVQSQQQDINEMKKLIAELKTPMAKTK
jgi:hypothetical protein